MWFIRYYPSGLITHRDDRVDFPGTFPTQEDADEAADLLRTRLVDAVSARRTDQHPSRQLLRVARNLYLEALEGDPAVPTGTHRAAKSRLEVALKDSTALSRPVAYLSRHAEAILAEVDGSTTVKGRPKSENTKSGIRTSLTNFGKWLVKGGYLETNPFAPDKEKAEERVASRRAASRVQAVDRARSNTLDPTEGDGDTGITIKDVPSLPVVVALRDAVVRRASGTSRPTAGRGCRGGAKPLSLQDAKRIAESILVRAFCGLRTCETLALHSSRISDDGHEIRVNRQLDRYTSWTPGTAAENMMVPPKFNRDRTAVVWPDFAPLLAELRDEADATSDGWLFPRTRHQRWWAKAYEDLLDDSIALLNREHDAGVTNVATGDPVPAWQWAPHYLRHVYGSYSLAPQVAGGLEWSVKLVSVSLGHADTGTTEKIYIHPTRAEREIIRTRRLGIQGL